MQGVPLKPLPRKYQEMLFKCGSIFLGNAILAFSIAAFVVPHDIIMGGVTGLGILCNRIFGVDVALAVLILNILALLLGYLVLGKQFFVATVASSLLYPVLLGFMQALPGISSLTDNILLASLFAGGLIGISLGLVIRVGASTGGIDVVNLVLHKWLHIPVSVLVYIVDFFILGGQALVSQSSQILYGIMLLVVETVVLNQVMVLGQAQIQIFAISAYFEEIRDKLLAELHVGVTMLLIETGCMQQQQKGVLCVIPPRKLFAAKELIQAIDPNAFITITQIKEVRGQGFTLERKDCLPGKKDSGTNP